MRSFCRGLLLLPIAVLAGCGGGGEDDYENSPRPATPINVTAAITDERVSVSPETFGAGPIVLIVSNQSGSEQAVTFETDEIGGENPGLSKATDTIAPSGTASLQVDVREGTYAVRVGDQGIEPAAVEVSGERASAQDALLQP